MVGRVPDFGLQSLSFTPSSGLGEGGGPLAHSLEIWEQGYYWRGVMGYLPLMGKQVKLPIQLTHRDGLGVEHIVVDSLVHAAADGWLSFQ